MEFKKYELKAYQTLYVDTPGKDFTTIKLVLAGHDFVEGDRITYDSCGFGLYLDKVDGEIVEGRIVTNEKNVYLPKSCLNEGTLWWDKRKEFEDSISEGMNTTEIKTHSEPTLEQAIKVLQKHLREDKTEGSYYYSWQSNIAMAFYDEFTRHMQEEQTASFSYDAPLLEVSNQAAKNFLDLLIKE